MDQAGLGHKVRSERRTRSGTPGLLLGSTRGRMGDDRSYRLTFVEVEESYARNSRNPGPGRDPSEKEPSWESEGEG